MGVRPGAPQYLESAIGPEIVLDGKRYINFGGSAYLGLASNQQILEAGITALRQFGCGGRPTPSSQGPNAHTFLEVEAEAARFFGYEAAFYMCAGYYFGLAAMAVLRKEFAAVFFDVPTSGCRRS
jgi:7-keto-8-aminopelargonate synthetase-like enzyme